MIVSNKPSMLLLLMICASIVAIVGSSSAVIAGQSMAAAKHLPVQLLRDENGDPMRTNDGQFVSENWSGYVLPEFETKQHYTAAQATWTVPEVFFQGFEAASSSWIGIGGYCKSMECKRGVADKTLIQLGTEQDAISDTETDYYAWYETLPGAEIQTTLVVNPGDVITASLSCAGKCKNEQSWTLTMTNETTRSSWSQVVTYKSSKLSVELIEEAPSDQSGILPLADFDIATFSDSTVAGAAANLSTGDSLIMENPAGQTSSVSAPNTTMDGFSACFSRDSTLAPCVYTVP